MGDRATYWREGMVTSDGMIVTRAHEGQIIDVKKNTGGSDPYSSRYRDRLPDFDLGAIMDDIPDYDEVRLDPGSYLEIFYGQQDANIALTEENIGRTIGEVQELGLSERYAASNLQNYNVIFEDLMPGGRDLIDRAISRVESNLAGRLSRETESAIIRSGAERAISGGAGLGVLAGRRTAATIGLAAEDLQNLGVQQAQSLYQTNAQIALNLTPDAAAIEQAWTNMLLGFRQQAGLVDPASPASIAQTTDQFNVGSQIEIGRQEANARISAYEAEFAKESALIAADEAEEQRKRIEEAREDAESGGLFGGIGGIVGSIAGSAFGPVGSIVGGTLGGAFGSAAAGGSAYQGLSLGLPLGVGIGTMATSSYYGSDGLFGWLGRQFGAGGNMEAAGAFSPIRSVPVEGRPYNANYAVGYA